MPFLQRYPAYTQFHKNQRQSKLFSRVIMFVLFSYNLGQNLLRHFTKIPIFATHPDKNAHCRKLKDCFPPLKIAMLFAITQKMHA